MNSASSVCWYLCGLFLVACVLSTVVTVVPGRELALAGVIVVSALSSVLFGGLALRLRRRSVPDWVLHAMQGLAVIVTVLLLLVSI